MKLNPHWKPYEDPNKKEHKISPRRQELRDCIIKTCKSHPEEWVPRETIIFYSRHLDLSSRLFDREMRHLIAVGILSKKSKSTYPKDIKYKLNEK